MTFALEVKTRITVCLLQVYIDCLRVFTISRPTCTAMVITKPHTVHSLISVHAANLSGMDLGQATQKPGHKTLKEPLINAYR